MWSQFKGIFNREVPQYEKNHETLAITFFMYRCRILDHPDGCSRPGLVL